MNAVKKTTRQTFVTLRRYAAAVAVLVVDNRIASATPANGIRGEMHDIKRNTRHPAGVFAPFGDREARAACRTSAGGANYVSVRRISR
jgi:hypothetical protein